MELLCFWFLVFAGEAFALWNNLNCPAPRSPENGLSFIFRNGELVHFRCHPGYMMHGKAVAYCVNSQWTAPAPECRPLRTQKLSEYSETSNKKNRKTESDHDYENLGSYQYYSHSGRGLENMTLKERRDQLNAKLFNWDKRQKSKKGAYGDGPRRVPLINGIWPGKEYQIMALGPQSTPGPMNMVREEVNIAELRQRQYEEIAKNRHNDTSSVPSKGRRRKGNKKRKNRKHKNSVIPGSAEEDREMVISVGKTEDGKALSIAFSRPQNETNEVASRHRYRHHDPEKKKRKSKKWQKVDSDTPNMIARSSRVDTSGLGPYSVRSRAKLGVAELRRRPVEKVHDDSTVGSSRSQYDTSCVESFYGRDLPMLAPSVPHAFVYRYETKKNKDFPFNSYMQVRYRCLTGYSFANARAQSMHCKEAKWVGEIPVCVPN